MELRELLERIKGYPGLQSILLEGLTDEEWEKYVESLPSLANDEVEALEQLRQELLPYYQRYERYLENFPASSAHPDRMKETGNHLQTIRKDAGLSREYVAGELGVELVLLAAFEGGLVPPADLPEGFESKLCSILLAAIRKQSSTE